MTSDIQLEANRANAQKSTGPTSEPGKAAVRFNATRHGLTSHVACMTWEDRKAFNQFCAAIRADLKPEGAVETQLAQSIAEDHWRLNRAHAIEENLFALGLENSTIDAGDQRATAALSQAETFRDNLKSFNLITLYESRINRNLHRNMDRLRQFQSDRLEAQADHAEAQADHAEAQADQAKAQANQLKAQTNNRAAALSAVSPSASGNANRESVHTHHGFAFSDAKLALATNDQNLPTLPAEATAPAAGIQCASSKSPKSSQMITLRDAA